MNSNVNHNFNELAESLTNKEKIKILFVCLGNICRSPAAHGIMQALIDQRKLNQAYEIDSAGLYGGHAGELPDRRMRVHAMQRGYNLIHRSRPVSESDFYDFDIILAMDDSNFDRLRRIAPTPELERKVIRMIDFVKTFPEYHSVPDPYYEGSEGFEIVLDLLEEGCANLLDQLETRKK